MFHRFHVVRQLPDGAAHLALPAHRMPGVALTLVFPVVALACRCRSPSSSRALSRICVLPSVLLPRRLRSTGGISGASPPMSAEVQGGALPAAPSDTNTDSPVLAAATSPASSAAPDAFCHELPDELARSLQKRKRQLLIEFGWKIQSFGQELETITNAGVRNALGAAKSMVRGSKHEETHRQSIKALAAKTGVVTATESALASSEKMLGINQSVRLSSVDTIPFKLNGISSSIQTVAEQQGKIDLITERLREAMDKDRTAEFLKMPVSPKRSTRKKA